MITAQKELLREIETLPVNFVQEVSDFRGTGTPPDEDAVWADL
jgi:hypothetical protein